MEKVEQALHDHKSGRQWSVQVLFSLKKNGECV